MKIRRDFVTNSSSSSYILAVESTWDEFVGKKLKDCVNEDLLSSLDVLIRILDSKKGYLTKGGAVAILDRYFECRKDYIKNWEAIVKKFENLSDSYYFYDLGEFSDDDASVCWAIESMLERNEVFKDCDGVEIYYMSNH